MLGEGERTQKTRMRQSRDYSGRVGLGDAKLGGGGEVRRDTGGGAALLRVRKAARGGGAASDGKTCATCGQRGGAWAVAKPLTLYVGQRAAEGQGLSPGRGLRSADFRPAGRAEGVDRACWFRGSGRNAGGWNPEPVCRG